MEFYKKEDIEKKIVQEILEADWQFENAKERVERALNNMEVYEFDLPGNPVSKLHEKVEEIKALYRSLPEEIKGSDHVMHIEEFEIWIFP